MTLPLIQEQLDFLVDLAKYRPDWLNSFFIFLNYFDTPYFVLLLIPFIWIGFSPKWGLQTAYLCVISALLNAQLKLSFGWPRPGICLETLPLLPFHSFGFPSGGAQTSMLLGLLLIHCWRTWQAWVIGISYILLISFSRLYLGVHFPLDILGGWVIGAILFVLFSRIEKYLMSFFAIKKFGVYLILVTMVGITYILLSPTPKIFAFMGFLMGLTFGMLITKLAGFELPMKKSFGEKVCRGLIVAGSTLALFFCLPHTLFPFFSALILSLWISVVAGPLYTFLNSPMKKK